MKAKTQHNDMVGTVAADIISQIDTLAQSLGIDTEKFLPVGISISGTDGFSVSFICMDKRKNTANHQPVVAIDIENNENNILNCVFEKLNIVCYHKHYSQYSELEVKEHLRLSEIK